MVKRLTNLKSTNKEGSRLVHVTVAADKNGANPELVFFICDEEKTKSGIILAPDETRKVSQSHNRSGKCWVIVTDKESKKETKKFLDLDATESF